MSDPGPVSVDDADIESISGPTTSARRRPASAFADGWSVTFSRFLVVVTEARIADADGMIRFNFAFVLTMGGRGPSSGGRWKRVCRARTWSCWRV